jgi:hypothetical protein
MSSDQQWRTSVRTLDWSVLPPADRDERLIFLLDSQARRPPDGCEEMTALAVRETHWASPHPLRMSGPREYPLFARGPPPPSLVTSMDVLKTDADGGARQL